MAFDPYFTHGWKQMPGAITNSEQQSNGCFDCNICLDFAHEPVVTLCGHLYCWPCIYKWLHVQSESLSYDEPPQCPVCKADISHTKMVPLYGRGQTEDKAEIESPGSNHRTVIPPRPAACGNQALTSTTGQQLPYRNPYQNPYIDPHSDYDDSDSMGSLPGFEGSSINGFHNLTVGMFGEMVYSRVFGNIESLRAYSNSYYLTGNGSARLRRLEMQADKSLNRISIFLFCCLVLCLIVF